MTSKALIPVVIERFENKTALNIFSILAGVLFLSLLAQVYLPLSWTPVPITGQTLGVSLVSLFLGFKRGGIALSLYLALGAVGLPVFAMGGAGLLLGPTLGYLFGMFLASMVVGFLSDLGVARSFMSTLFVCYIGSAVIFSAGVFGLSFFLESGLFVAGVFPFLLGDLIKNTLSALIYSGFKRN